MSLNLRFKGGVATARSMSNKSEMQSFHGKCLSPGFAEGEIFIHRDSYVSPDELYDIELTQVAVEQGRFELAIDKILQDLNTLATRVEKEMDSQVAEIFEAHQLMLQDPALTDDLQQHIAEELVSAGSAVRAVFKRWQRRFQALDSQIAGQKADDLHDLARRILNTLAGVHGHVLENMPAGRILVAKRLLPSDTVYLSRQSAAGALLEFGGFGSHAALFAREIGLPCLAQLPGVVDKVQNGMFAQVDAESCIATINPDERSRADFYSKVNRSRRMTLAARQHAHESAVSLDGVSVNVLANIGSVEDAQEAAANGADGVGLYRIEKFYIGRQTPPDKAQLMTELKKTLDISGAGVMTVRLLDVGADKPLPFLDSFREPNPSLGCRGVRLLLRYPDLLRTQLRALLQLSTHHDIRVLVPMVALSGDMDSVRHELQQCARLEGVEALPPLGAMIETPAAALAAGEIARHADFLSVGTNDLTQYTFAADRENASVDDYFDDSHEVIFKLLRMMCKELPAQSVSVCGELAGRAEHTRELLRAGVTTLSVAPPLVPVIKQAVRQSQVSS